MYHIWPKEKIFFPAFTDKVVFSGTNTCNAVNFPPNNTFGPFKTRKYQKC